MNSDQMSVETA